MENIILSLPQATIDRTYQVGDRISNFSKDFATFFEFHKESEDAFNEIAENGLARDYNISLPLENNSLVAIGKADQYLDQRGYHPSTNIGGNPAILALRGHSLRGRNEDTKLPRVKYAGVLPASLQTFIEHQADEAQKYLLREVFDAELCHLRKDEPQTIALESDKKIILSYGPGRNLSYLSEAEDFSSYVNSLKANLSLDPNCRIVVAFSIPHPLHLGAKLIDELKLAFGEKLKVYVGLSTLRKGTKIKNQLIQDLNQHILNRVDILTMNDAELHDLDTGLVGDYRDIPLAQKLKELPVKAIMVCHSADGAIMNVNCQPEAIVNSDHFNEDPAAFLKETLRLATDGASYALDSIDTGRTASETLVRIYSSSIENRSIGRFDATFLNVLEKMPAGLISVQAPQIGRPLSAVTGVGAMFDSLFLSFLMRR